MQVYPLKVLFDLQNLANNTEFRACSCRSVLRHRYEPEPTKPARPKAVVLAGGGKTLEYDKPQNTWGRLTLELPQLLATMYQFLGLLAEKDLAPTHEIFSTSETVTA